MVDSIHCALSKIRSRLVDEATDIVIGKLSEKVENLKILPEKLDAIKITLCTINHTITYMGTPHPRSYLYKCWILEVEELGYRVEDAMDKYLYHALQLKTKRWMNKAHHDHIRIFGEIAHELICLERKTQNALNRKDRWLSGNLLNLNPVAQHDMECYHYRAFFPELVVGDDLVGIEDSRRMLTEWLCSCEQAGQKVITVSGMGGLGKTTLVRNVYEQVKINFTACSWIPVSRVYDVSHLLRLLLRKIWYLEQKQPAQMDVTDMKEKIKEKLKDARYLIVFDDVWDPEAYTQIQDVFQDLQDCRIIITTRIEQVAALAHQTHRLKMKPLGHSDAFKLFCLRAFFNMKDHMCPPEIEDLAKGIVSRCHGLPLAIVSAGSLLSTRLPTEFAWTQISSHLWSELKKHDHVQAILNLSYHDLPGDLRNCFLYCTLFPQDFQFSRESLVRLWVAEGFAVGNEEHTAEEMAERYFMELIQRNMMEVVEHDELGRVSTCKMHVVMRDLAIPIAVTEEFGFLHNLQTMTQMDRGVRRLSSCGWSDQTALWFKLPRLRTIVSVGMTASSSQLLSSFFSEATYLTVLELQDSAIAELPDFIGHLFNLRYIGLRCTGVKSLPESVRKLSNLQTLDIKQTKVKKLPRGIVKANKLRHLLADWNAHEKESEFQDSIGVQAPKQLSNLEELQTLETVGSSKDLPRQLMKLIRLRSLWIDNIKAADCADLFTALSNMPLLSSLLLSAKDENEVICFEHLQPSSTHLHKLIIKGQWATGTLDCPIFRDYGANLKFLDLSWCHLGEYPLQLLASRVPSLVYLSLNRVSSASRLVLSAGCFPQMKTLALKHMPDVNQLEIMEGALPLIESLHIESLRNLVNVPQGIESLPFLKKLWLLDLLNLGEDPLGVLVPCLPNLTYLGLSNMHSANSLLLPAGSFPRLKTLVVKHMHDVNNVEITDGALQSIEDMYIESLPKLDSVPRGIESLPYLKKLCLLGLHEDFRTQWDKNGMQQKMLHVPEVRV